ncbi:MAG: asparagine synthase-related protein, partial [Halioglobus sp.]
DVKMPGYNLREFYKDSCRGFLPDDTLSKSKHGFGLPFGLWMKENASLQALSRECVDSFRQRRILSDALIDDAIKSHETVHASYYGELIWIIVILELWLQRDPS